MKTTWHVTYDGARPLQDDLGVVAYEKGDYINTVTGEGWVEADAVEAIVVALAAFGIRIHRRDICAIRL